MSDYTDKFYESEREVLDLQEAERLAASRAAELDQRIQQIDEQLKYLRDLRSDLKVEWAAARYQVRAARLKITTTRAHQGVTTDEEETMVINGLLKQNATAATRGVDVIRLVYPLSIAAHRQIEPFEARPLLRRLARKGLVVRTGFTRATVYHLNMEHPRVKDLAAAYADANPA